MDTQSTMNRVTALIILGLLLLGILSGLYYYVYVMSNDPKKDLSEFVSAYKAFEMPHHQGNVDEAVPALRQLLTDAPTPMWAAQVKLKLAYDLFLRNRGNDRQEAYGLYKVVASDEDAPPLYRALALTDMTFTVHVVDDESLATTYIFNELPYSQFLEQAGGDVNIALRRMYELSDSIYPNAFAKIQIALLYARRLNSGKTVPEQTREETAELIQKYLKDADPLLTAVPYEKSKLAQLYLSRATSLGTSERVLRNVSLSDLEEAYKQSIEIAVSAGNEDVHARAVANLARLFSAVAIYSRAGKERESDVRNLLETVTTNVTSTSDVSNDMVLQYLGNISARPQSDFVKLQIVALGEVSPEFKDLLRKLGWGV